MIYIAIGGIGDFFLLRFHLFLYAKKLVDKYYTCLLAYTKYVYMYVYVQYL